ncbi:MAG: VOC family protein [Bacteroidetes bacterium]|nr:VOC family protein [Bacteroidota bacterium]
MAKEMYPCLWFDGQAQAAAEFYCSIFPNSKILSDTGMVVSFELDGKNFIGLNGGDMYHFTEAVSFVIPCEDQAEIDHYWSRLTAHDGQESQCGWCKDQFGLSWQVAPAHLGELMSHPTNGQKVIQAMMKMKKIDIATLENASKA